MTGLCNVEMGDVLAIYSEEVFYWHKWRQRRTNRIYQ